MDPKRTGRRNGDYRRGGLDGEGRGEDAVPSSGVRIKCFIQRGIDCGDGAVQRDYLPHELTCKEALEAAASLLIGAHSCDTYLRRLTEKRTLRRVSEGKYRLADAAKPLKDE